MHNGNKTTPVSPKKLFGYGFSHHMLGLSRAVRQIVAGTMSLLIGLQPLLAQAAEIRVDQNASSAHRPGIDAAGNGVPLVNIVTPNASGLSHNKYNQFNVGQPGLILNNSNQDLLRSQLGGLVQGNANLRNSGPARVILNEVTSSSRSLLEGAIEVHGRSADVVIANPNGITCNGCGFINTPRVTISTGTPEFDSNGALTNLRVEGGDINIGLRGANLGSVNIFDIVSRKISIGGPLKVGGDLNLVAGRNSYAYQSGLITPLASDGNEPGVAIDSSLLGGMYAGKIKIISTDRGAGVRMLGQMAANAHGMTLTGNGRLVLGKVRAKKTILVKSATDSVQVQNTLFSEEAIILEGASSVILDDNALIASQGDVSLKGQTVTLGSDAMVAAGVDEDGVQSAVGDLLIEADLVDAGKGQLAAGNALTILANSIDIQRATDDDTDTLKSLGSIVLKSNSILAQNSRITALGSLTLLSRTPSTSLILTGGKYSSTGNLLTEAANLNSSADLRSQETVALRSLSGGILNSGHVAGDAGTLVDAATTLTNTGKIVSKAQVTATAGTILNNAAAGQIIGDGGVELNATSITNAGETAAQGGVLTINSDGDVDNSGTLSSSETAIFNIDGTLTNSGKLAIEQALVIRGKNNSHATALVNTASGTINTGSANISVASLINAGVLKTHETSLTIDVTGNITNSGTIEAKTNANILLDGDLTNSGSIITEGALVLAGRSGGRMGALTTLVGSLINGSAGVTIKASNISNAGSIGSSGGALMAEITGNITNTGLLYSGASSHFKLDGIFTNINADVLAETNIIIEGLGSARAAALLNLSGVIEAVSGNLIVKADTVVNERNLLVIGTSSTTNVTSSGSTTTTVVTTRETLDQSSAPSKLLAGGNIDIDTDTLSNSYSQIAANGDITIVATAATNTGRDLIETVETTAVTQHSERYCSRRIFGICISHKTRHWTTTNHNTSSSTYAAVYGTIQAGGALNATVTGYLSNNAVRASASQIGLASGSRALEGANVSTDSDVLDPVNLTKLTVAIDALLGRSALFDVELSPNAPFLLETRSEFIDPGKFLGSDYFLSRVGGYDPDLTMKRFGDAYVEYRLIQDQIFEQTGMRYLTGYLDERAQMQALYDNAIDEQKNLNLIFGVALTPDQIAGLTKDIVWLESRIVSGQEVLVPRLYLASSTRSNVNMASAQIKAGQANIHTVTLINSGDITGRDGLDITATDAVLNQGGGLFSDADITIDAGKLFSNQSGTVSGDNVSIKADNILHDTAKTRDKRANGFTDRMQQIARIEAKGDLDLEASETIASEGGLFKSGGTTTLKAGQNIDISALELERLSDDKIDGGYDRSSSLTNKLASINAGGGLNIEAEGDVNLRGVNTTSGEDTNISAGDDVNITAVQDRQSHDLKLHIKGSGLFGNDTKIRRQTASVKTKASTITSGGDNLIKSKSADVTVKASKLESEGTTTLEAKKGKVNLLANIDTEFKRDEKREEDLFWWNEADKGQSSQTLKHVQIEAGGGLTIDAGNGIIIEYKKTGSFSASIDQLSKAKGLEWMGDLKNDPRVNWKGVEEQFNNWDYKSQGLTEAGAAVVALVVAAASAGTLSALSASMAAVLPAGMQPIAAAAIKAGLGSLLTQASVSLVNNGGDLAATLKQLGSSASLRALATAMVTAGLTAGLTDLAGLNIDLPANATIAQKVQLSLQRNLLRTSISAGVSTAINGGKLDKALLNAMRVAAADTLGEVVAGEIGASYFGAKQDGLDFGEYAVHKIAHAALGCLSGAIGSGDCGSGAIGGAVGAVVSEGYDALTRDQLSAELNALIKSGDEQQAQEKFVQWRQRGVDLSKLAGGLLAAASGADVDVAAGTSGNAAEHNVLPAIIIIAKLGIAAYTAYELYDTAKKAVALFDKLQSGEEFTQAELKGMALQLGIDVGIGVVVSKLKILQAIGNLAQKAGLKDKATKVASYIKKSFDGKGVDNPNYKGGAHKDTSKPKGDGLDSHHCPAKNCYKNAPISSADGPAIQMDPADHRITSSYGGSREAIEYRAKQQQLVDQGKLREAVQMDIDDIRGNFGNKYDGAIQDMLTYINKLSPNDFTKK